MKKVIICLLVLLMCVSLAACGGATAAEDFDYEMVSGEIIITGYHGTDRELVVPREIENRPVTQIGEKAFKGYDLTSIRFSDGMEVIGKGAFLGCECLVDVVFPDSLRRIEQQAFDGCDALANVELPEKLEYLGGWSFNCDAMTELELPNGFTGFQIDYKTWIEGGTVLQGERISSPVSDETMLIGFGRNSETYNLIVRYGTSEMKGNLAAIRD